MAIYSPMNACGYEKSGKRPGTDRSFPPTNTCLQTLDLGASWGDEGQGDKLREAINPILGGQEEVLEEVAPET